MTTAVVTTGDTVQQAFNEAIGSATVTGLGANTDAFVSFYDTTNSRAVILAVASDNGVTTSIETGDEAEIIGSISMSATDYAAFNANDLAIIA